MNTSELIAEALQEISRPRQDLSAVLADIDLSCQALEGYEPGLWWNLESHRRNIQHPAVTAWLAHYGFVSISQLPPAALIACRDSLHRRIAVIERGLYPSSQQG